MFFVFIRFGVILRGRNGCRFFVKRQGDTFDYRLKEVGEAHESEVCEMDSVDRRLVVSADKMVGREIVKVAIFGSEFFVALFHHGVTGVDLSTGRMVEAFVWEIGVFDKKERYVRVSLADDFEEWNHEGVDLLLVDVGHEVENNETGVGHGGDDARDFEVELTIATEAEVDYLAVKATGEDISMSHAGAVGAAALKDACAIHDDGSLGVENIGGL